MKNRVYFACTQPIKQAKNERDKTHDNPSDNFEYELSTWKTKTEKEPSKYSTI